LIESNNRKGVRRPHLGDARGAQMLRHASSVEDAIHAPATADGDCDPLSGAPAGRAWGGGTREAAAYDPLR